MSDRGADALPLILVVDDDPGIQRLLSRYLREQGFETAVVGDGRDMDSWLQRHRPDLIVLDLMLPGEDGLSIARRLRAMDDVAIIMLTAMGEDVDRIVGLEMGADDYLAKPFNPRELLARIRAVLRRGPGRAGREAPASDSPLQFGDFSLDLERSLLFRNGEEVHLRDMSGNRTLVVFDTGDEVVVQAGEQGIRFLLVSGKPIREPVAWHGPIVMNTQAELMQAFADLRNGTFIRENAVA